MIDLSAEANPIRIATEADYQPLFTACRQLHAENGQHPLSDLKLLNLLWRGIQRDRAIIGMIGTPDDIRAMLYLAIEEVYYSDDLELMELWNYVREDCRRSDFAKRLIDYAKTCAEETNLMLRIGVISNVRMEPKCRLYRRRLHKAGEFFVHVPSGLSQVSVAA